MIARTLILTLLIIMPVSGCSEDVVTPDNQLPTSTGSYSIVDTGQSDCFGASVVIAVPAAGAPFYGQDAQVDGQQPSYSDNGDGTVTDLVTGLMWQQDPGDKMGMTAAMSGATTFNLAGYSDWRLPTIKELYSLIDFDGTDPSGLIDNDTSGLTPFIDSVFEFAYGDPASGERVIDSQYASSTFYVGTTMNGDETVFGVNFADGRIKGYPRNDPFSGGEKDFFVQYVRAGDSYGVNDFVDNGDDTITDNATDLMWMQQDSGHLGDDGMTWEGALAWAENLTYAGSDDWRLPNAKELQSIIDYTRSPQTHGVAAIDPVFLTSTITVEDGSSDFPFYWSSSTHVNDQGNGANACYLAFGTGYGWMEFPPNSGNYQFMDVHGAGCQRSDPKVGDPANYPYGHGPQGDVIRIYNYVRCVRDASSTTEAAEIPASLDIGLKVVPNPMNPSTEIRFEMAEDGHARVEIFDVSGRRVETISDGLLTAGDHTMQWDGRGDDARGLESGVYLVLVTTKNGAVSSKVSLTR
jgi:hypothetical protein